jgi:hypothetical protein
MLARLVAGLLWVGARHWPFTLALLGRVSDVEGSWAAMLPEWSLGEF